MPSQRRRRFRPRITAGPPPGGDRVVTLIRRLDWMFLLCARLGLQAGTCSPLLLRTVAAAIPLERSLAAVLLARIGVSRTRQDVLAGLLRAEAVASSGCGDAAQEYVVLWQCLGDLDAEHGSQLRRLTAAPARAARARLKALIDDVPDPSMLLATAVERPSVVICPTLWLPPPQDGRHAAIVPTPRGTTVLLWLGMPAEGPLPVAVTPTFLRDGVWVMWLRAYLQQVCPWLRDGAPRSLTRLAAQALASKRRFSTAENLVLRHLAVVIQAQLFAANGGAPDSIREMALAQGYWWFDWFWRDLNAKPRAISLDRWLADLLERMLADRGTLRQTWQRPTLASTKVSVLFVEALHGGEVRLRVPAGIQRATRKALRERWSVVPMRLCTARHQSVSIRAPRGAQRGLISIVLDRQGRYREAVAPSVKLMAIAPARRSWHVVIRVPGAAALGMVGPELLALAGGD